MIFKDLLQFVEACKNKTRLVGLDVGTKNIGIAITDKDKTMSFPKETLRRKNDNFDYNYLLKFFEEQNAGGIVVGLPLDAQSKETKCSKLILKFIEKLTSLTNLPIYFVDERLTSMEAENMLIDELNVGFTKTKEVVDMVAASLILETYLRMLKNL